MTIPVKDESTEVFCITGYSWFTRKIHFTFF